VKKDSEMNVLIANEQLFFFFFTKTNKFLDIFVCGIFSTFYSETYRTSAWSSKWGICELYYAPQRTPQDFGLLLASTQHGPSFALQRWTVSMHYPAMNTHASFW